MMDVAGVSRTGLHLFAKASLINSAHLLTCRFASLTYGFDTSPKMVMALRMEVALLSQTQLAHTMNIHSVLK